MIFINCAVHQILKEVLAKGRFEVVEMVELRKDIFKLRELVIL